MRWEEVLRVNCANFGANILCDDICDGILKKSTECLCLPWVKIMRGEFPPPHGREAGGEVFHDWGGPPQAGNFAKLSHPNDDFPLENCISEGKISSKCQKFPPAAG